MCIRDRYRNTPYRFLENRTDCFKGLPGLFADSLPDTFGNQIINEWFASKGLSSEELTPLDRLCDEMCIRDRCGNVKSGELQLPVPSAAAGNVKTPENLIL